MTCRQRRRSLIIAIAALTGALGSAGAPATEITGTSGYVAFSYDEAIWTPRIGEAGEPEFDCIAETCGGDSASCGAATIRRDDADLADEAFMDRFRQTLDEKILEMAIIDQGVDSMPEIISPSSVAEFGGNTGIFVSMRIDLDGGPTRVDNLWLPAGSNLVGITCIVADAKYFRARVSFEQIYRNLTIRLQ